MERGLTPVHVCSVVCFKPALMRNSVFLEQDEATGNTYYYNEAGETTWEVWYDPELPLRGRMGGWERRTVRGRGCGVCGGRWMRQAEAVHVRGRERETDRQREIERERERGCNRVCNHLISCSSMQREQS